MYLSPKTVAKFPFKLLLKLNEIIYAKCFAQYLVLSMYLINRGWHY